MIGAFMHHKIAIASLAIVVIFGIWYVLRGGGGGERSLLVEENFAGASSEAEKDIVATLLQLRSITLEGTLFTDSVFQGLQDFGSQIIPEPVGRSNPFAPLGSRATTTPSSASEGRR